MTLKPGFNLVLNTGLWTFLRALTLFNLNTWITLLRKQSMIGKTLTPLLALE